MFDALKYIKVLEAVGFAREQAEAQVQMMAELVGAELATKQDLFIHKEQAGQEVMGVRQEIVLTREKLEHSMLRLEHRMTIRLGAMFIASTSLILAVMTYLTSLK